MQGVARHCLLHGEAIHINHGNIAAEFSYHIAHFAIGGKCNVARTETRCKLHGVGERRALCAYGVAIEAVGAEVGYQHYPSVGRRHCAVNMGRGLAHRVGAAACEQVASRAAGNLPVGVEVEYRYRASAIVGSDNLLSGNGYETRIGTHRVNALHVTETRCCGIVIHRIYARIASTLAHGIHMASVGGDCHIRGIHGMHRVDYR